MVHISARLAWHMDGWNGHVCRNPASNVHCVGNYSYPGPLIREKRDLAWESQPDVAGRSCSKVNGIPPCIYSVNAFGGEALTAYADIPQWLYPPGSRKEWPMPPATISIWPYEQMYRDEVSRGSRFGQKYDYERRLEYAKEYFAQVDEGKSLIFYYANYSNPFSEEDERKYVVVGMSRVKKLGDFQFHDDIPSDVAEQYGGAYVWQMNVTSTYPDEGLRLPYHLYLEQPGVAERFLFVPDNPRNFKYATRHISDDDALDLVERFIEITATLQELGDTSEDWSLRRDWLRSLIAELWDARGLFPGLPEVLHHVGFHAAIPYFKRKVEAGEEKDARAAIFAFLRGEGGPPRELDLSDEDAKRLARSWRLRDDDERHLLEDVLPRFDLAREQISRILGDGRQGWGIHASLGEVASNPYVLSEQYVGDGPDDTIAFSKIDHGAFPSPELGGDALGATDDWQRLRALVVDRLKREQKDVFVAAAQVIHDVNHRLSFLPDWKRHQFTERYLEVDEAELEGALTFRIEGGRRWIYLKDVYEDERTIEATLRDLAGRREIELRTPLTEEHWRNYLFDPHSPLAARAADEYRAAIEGQAKVCARVFTRPLAIVSGAAGTGKTTVINALLQAIERADGRGASFQLLAPTGKAAERLRGATHRRYPTATIHSFLARNGWLNDNFTFRRRGGTREESIATIVVDEASMLSLDLLATLFRAIHWKTVRRLVLVGDPNQLPPIGRGRVFADIIDWLNEMGGGSVGFLETNVRQMENRALGRGTALLDLASAFVRRGQSAEKDESEESHAELVLRRAQEGDDVDQDLRILYWRDAAELKELLIDTIVADMEVTAAPRSIPPSPGHCGATRSAARSSGQSTCRCSRRIAARSSGLTTSTEFFRRSSTASVPKSYATWTASGCSTRSFR
jgi:exodeoxyribonuclease V alpha subunit